MGLRSFALSDAMSYQRIEVRPLAGALGAEIHGADLSRTMDDETFREIHRAFLEHLVIFFRDQHLSSAQFKAFARRFGPLAIHESLQGLPDHPEILEFITEPDDPHVFSGGWHSDVTYQERPPLGSILYAQEVPGLGGDTLFSNQHLAYETLSAGMRGLLDRLRGRHSNALMYADVRDEERRHNMKVDNFQPGKSALPEEIRDHPVVRTHAETGRKALFVNDHYVVGFEGMSEADSRPLFEFLLEHAVRPEFTCRFRWRAHSIAFWDNRCTIHNPIDDFQGHRRRMRRIAIAGDRPS